MTKLAPRLFLNPRFFALPLLALVVIASFPVPGDPGQDQAGFTCIPAISVQDPAIRESFKRFDRSQSAAARKACAIFREYH